ncbi:MAG: hypothetical protein HY808_14990 [Nitrospirae bacterium]|nr:hypothetical protein [Nitrospirota bacterium]
MNKTALCILLISLLTACATAPTSIQKEKTGKAKVHTEHETKSLELFAEILNIVQSTDDRQSVLPEIEERYSKIIREYPDAPLAQESYLKLITIYVKDYSPPVYEKAYTLYSEFMEKYPDSPVKGYVEETLGNSYYQNAEWDKLLRLCAPSYKDYAQTGKHPRPSLIFFYSEANYNLGNFADAEKGYRITADIFPELGEGLKAQAMLQKMMK